MTQPLIIGRAFSDTLTSSLADVLTVNLSANVTYNFNLSGSRPLNFSISSVKYPDGFVWQQGIQAILNSYAARGLGVSGAVMVAVAQYLVNPDLRAAVVDYSVGSLVTYTPSITGTYSLAVDSAYSVSSTFFLPPAFGPVTYTLIGNIATPTTPPPPILHGSHDQFVVTNNNGSLHVEDKVGGQDETGTLPSGNVITFTDGTGVFDPTGTAEDVHRLYSAALGRAPDASGVQFWTAQADDSHVLLSDVANSFAASPEFINNYGSLSDLAFVQRLYQNVLDRPGEAGGVQFWQGALAAGTSRGAALLNFAEGAENQAKTLPTAGDRNNAEAYRLYQAALDRAPDQAGQSFWSLALKGGATPDQLAQGFIGSPEFQQKYGSLSASDFVSQLYQNVLHRAGDPSGQQFWTAQLQGGASQASVLVGFSDSPENRTQTASATHDGWVFIHA